MACKKAQKQVVLESIKRYEHKPQRHSPLIPAKLLEDPLLDLNAKTNHKTFDLDAGISRNNSDRISNGANQDSSSSSSDESDAGPRRAPNLLLMEFLECLMKKDFKAAHKLCKMILLYEPENKDAISFLPVIEIKIRQDAENELSRESDDNDEDDDDDSESSTSDEEISDDET